MGRMWVVSLVSLAGLCGTTRAAETKYEVETFPDLAYRSDKAADPERHKLDLYVPKGAKDFPVLLFVHGGDVAVREQEPLHSARHDVRALRHRRRRHQLPALAEGQAPRPRRGRGPGVRLDGREHRQVRRPGGPRLPQRPLGRRPPRFPARPRRDLPQGRRPVRWRTSAA